MQINSTHTQRGLKEIPHICYPEVTNGHRGRGGDGDSKGGVERVAIKQIKVGINVAVNAGAEKEGVFVQSVVTPRTSLERDASFKGAEILEVSSQTCGLSPSPPAGGTTAEMNAQNRAEVVPKDARSDPGNLRTFEGHSSRTSACAAAPSRARRSARLPTTAHFLLSSCKTQAEWQIKAARCSVRNVNAAALWHGTSVRARSK